MTLKGVEFLSCSAPAKDQGDTVPSEEGQNGWTAVRALTSLYPVTRQSIDIRTRYCAPAGLHVGRGK